MPHVVVNLWPGKSEAQKKRLAEAITQDVMKVLNYGEESVSVGFEEISSSDWAASSTARQRPDVRSCVSARKPRPARTRSSTGPSPMAANSGRSINGIGSASPTTDASAATRRSAFFDPKPL